MFATLETNQIKSTYVFFRQTITIGDLYFWAYSEEIMNNYTLYVKVRTILHNAKSSLENVIEEKDIELVESLEHTLNMLNKIKNKPQHVLVQIKKMEPYINELFQETKIRVQEKLAEMGFNTLKDIEKKPEFLMVNLRQNKPEEKISQAKYSIKMSDALQLKLPDFNSGCNLPVVGYNYFETTFNSSKPLPNFGTTTTTFKNEIGFMQYLFKSPPFSNFSGSELKSLRNHFEKLSTKLEEKVDHWAVLFQDSNQTIEERIQYFNQEILPIANDIQDEIHNQHLFKFVNENAYQNKTFLRLYLGETTIENLWNYYKTMNVVIDITWKKLEKILTENKEYAQKRIPIIGFMIENLNYDTNEAKKEIEESNNLEIKSVKKAINLDDF